MSGAHVTMIEATVFALVVAVPFLWWWLEGKPAGDEEELTPIQEKNFYDHRDLRFDRDTDARDVATVPAVEPEKANQEGATQTSKKQDKSSYNKKHNFIVRHWRGDIPLPIAYWGICIFLSITVVAVLYGVGAVLQGPHLAPVILALGLLIFTLFLYSFTVWHFVGVWRSAVKYNVNTGRIFLSGLARLTVVLVALLTLTDLIMVSGPILVEATKLAIWKEGIPPHKLSIMRYGTEVELSGGMPYGTAEALRKLLDANPTVRVVHLNNTGGRLDEGIRIQKLLKARKLTSYTATRCESACTIAFIGGHQRLLAQKAKLGFHGMRFGRLDERKLPGINAVIRKTLRLHGAKSWFIEKALSTPPHSIWYPTKKELLSSRIITRVVDSSQFRFSDILEVKLSPG